MKLLHIDSSILGDNSVSRAISAAVVARMREVHGNDLEVTTRDLAMTPIPHLTGAYLAGQGADVKHDQAMQENLDLGGAALAEFQAADIVVIGSPLYNFTIPTQLKAWIDRIVIAGQTFHYAETGPVGLATGKRVVLALSRGGFYGAGTPHSGLDHGESYLRTVFGFLGVAEVTSIIAEGVATGPEQRRTALDAALATATALG
nr:FMN-dependent NADH-azoreductase [uncultured Lichenicoccus sp.]